MAMIFFEKFGHASSATALTAIVPSQPNSTRTAAMSGNLLTSIGRQRW